MRSRTISMAIAATVLTTIGASAAYATTEPPESTGGPTAPRPATDGAGRHDPRSGGVRRGVDPRGRRVHVATGEPAFPPYVIDDDPTSGEGFEAARRLRRRPGDGLRARRRRVGAHGVRRRDAPGSEGLRREHPAVQHHARARGGRGVQPSVLHEQPRGDRVRRYACCRSNLAAGAAGAEHRGGLGHVEPPIRRGRACSRRTRRRSSTTTPPSSRR